MSVRKAESSIVGMNQLFESINNVSRMAYFYAYKNEWVLLNKSISWRMMNWANSNLIHF